MSTRIHEHELALARMKKDEDKLSKANQKLVIEQESLEVKVENYEKTVIYLFFEIYILIKLHFKHPLHPFARAIYQVKL